jgi:hypothetical protein
MGVLDRVTRSLFPDAATVRRRQGPRGRQPWRHPGGSSPGRLASHFESHFRTSRVRRSATLAAFHDGRRYLIRDKWPRWSACFFGCSRTSYGERASTRGISLIATGDDQNSERCLTTPTPRRQGLEFFDSASVQERSCAANPPAIRGSWKRQPRSTLRRLEIPTARGVDRPLFRATFPHSLRRPAMRSPVPRQRPAPRRGSVSTIRNPVPSSARVAVDAAGVPVESPAGAAVFKEIDNSASPHGGCVQVSECPLAGRGSLAVSSGTLHEFSCSSPFFG